MNVELGTADRGRFQSQVALPRTPPVAAPGEAGGLSDVLRWSLRGAESRATRPGQSAYDIAIDYAAIGAVEPALDWLERAFDDEESDLVDLAVDPRLDALRSSERFQTLERRVGI